MFGKEFRDFCFANSIDSFNDFDGKLLLTQSGFESIRKLVNLYDGSKGGLIIGKSHFEGGVHLIQPNANKTYKYVGEMEGNEYLSPPKLPPNIFQELEEINLRKSGTQELIPNNMNVLNLVQDKIQIVVLSFYSQLIINKISTMNNLKRIAELVNKSG